jgi:hypothetical protein
LAILCACSPSLTTKTLTYGPSEKVCQLTGEKDWKRGNPTTTLTERFGLRATDLGYPVEHNGQLALLFGDTSKIPPRAGDESGPPDDAVGWITSRTPPTESECTDLRINHLFPKLVLSPQVVSPAPIKQGIFNVPSGGVSNGGWLYAFFWTDHCNSSKTCPESEFLNSVGRGVLARSNDNGVTFRDAVPMPRGFVYSTAVDAAAIADLPAEQRLGTYVFGVPRYRDSVPYMANAPPGTLGDPSSWQFFVGLKPDGQPSWTSKDAWERGRGGPWSPPGRAELFTALTDRCVGEFSVTWNRALRVWLLLYNCYLSEPQQSIVARIAETPWGPWSDGTVILNPSRDGSWCNLLMNNTRDNTRCGGLEDYWPNDKFNGDFYAPFVMERYTTPVRTFFPGKLRATIYWLVSTWNPYQVIVMRTTLDVTDTWPTIKSIFRGDAAGGGH